MNIPIKKGINSFRFKTEPFPSRNLVGLNSVGSSQISGSMCTEFMQGMTTLPAGITYLSSTTSSKVE